MGDRDLARGRVAVWGTEPRFLLGGSGPVDELGGAWRHPLVDLLSHKNGTRKARFLEEVSDQGRFSGSESGLIAHALA